MQHEFVSAIPERLEEGVLYISLDYATAVHNCACGCGHEVVTPLSPTDWSIIFNGETISLDHSIGNWSFPCRSHYWIRQGRVDWAGPMSNEDIAKGRAWDVARKTAYFGAMSPIVTTAPPQPVRSPWSRFLRWLHG